MKIVAGIPAYNKQYQVCGVIHAIAEYVDETLVVDDGSADNTAILAERAGAVVILHDANRGKTAAIQTLINEALSRGADVLVLLGADGQHNPDEIPTLVKPVLHDGYEFVLGSRRLKESKKDGKKPFIRPFGQFVLKPSWGTITKNDCSDPECGFRALSRRAMEVMKFRGAGFTVEAEMICLARTHGLKSTEVPVTEVYIENGLTLNTGKHEFGNLKTIFSWISEERPLFFFGVMGLVLAITGLVIGAKVLYIVTTSGGVAIGTALVSMLC
ncbi:MAG: glycosyltransferase family 2 protein, partial [Methanosarcinales archaeon]